MFFLVPLNIIYDKFSDFTVYLGIATFAVALEVLEMAIFVIKHKTFNNKRSKEDIQQLAINIQTAA